MRFCLVFRKHNWCILQFFFVFMVSSLLLQPVLAQSSNSQLKIAKSLEKRHNYDDALRIYQDIYKKNLRNMAAIAGIKNCYIELQQYAILIQFLEKVVQEQKGMSNWHVDLAEAYFLNNEREQAFSLWGRFLQQNKTDPSAYRLVAGTMVRQRLFDEAILIYTKAIHDLKRQEILHVDIANLYRAQLNYEKACEHYLQYYIKFPKQFTFVQRQLLLLSNKGNKNSLVTDAILSFLRQNPDQIKIKEILAGIYLKDKKFSEAFNVYKNMETDRSSGKYLYQYATEAYANNAFDHAIEGYEYLIYKYPSSPLILQARYELGRSYAAWAYRLDHNEESAKSMQRAIEIFEFEQSSRDNQIYATRSLINLGDIYFEYYFDLDMAIKYYRIYLDKVSSGKTRDEVLIRLGDVYLTKNQTDRALGTYQLVAQNDLKNLSGYKIAEIYFFNHKFTLAHRHLKQLLINMPAADPLMNDILTRNFLIKSFIQDSLILTKFADAELLKFQKKYIQSAEAYEELCQEKSNLQSLSGRNAGKLYLRLKRYDSAKEVLRFLRKEIPDDKYFDEILFLLAESEEGLNNFQAATDILHELMVAYPNSLFIQDVRERARILNDKIAREQI